MSNQKYSDDDVNWDDPSIKDFELMQRYAFVSQRAIDNNYIGFCYREYGDTKIDSGWRILYGDEDEDFLDNPGNVQTMDLSEVVVWKPAVKDILTLKPGTELEWNPDTETFELY